MELWPLYMHWLLFVKRFYIVEEALGEPDPFADKKNEFMGHAWEGNAEIKKYNRRELVGDRFDGGAVFICFFLGLGWVA